MCQSKANGGRRCPQTPTGRAHRGLRARIDRAFGSGDPARAQQASAALARLEAARARYGDVVTPMALPLPAEVEQVFTVLRSPGYRPLVVGGSVRDALDDGRAPKDIDIEVYGASIDEVAATLTAAGYRVDEVGKAFGVLKAVLPDGTDLDVSVPRRDNHVSAGHRGFEVETDRNMTVAEAAARRDYTLNSMGYDPEYQVCVDPYNGRQDLADKVLRHTSAAFVEDPLRVLRGFQFGARYEMTLAPETAALCRSLVPRATELPVERIRGEWGKFYAKGTAPGHGLAVLADTGWDTTVPGLAAANTPATRAQVEQAHRIARAERVDADTRTRLLAATIARGMTDADARAFISHTIEGAEQQSAAYGLSRASAPAEGDDTAVRVWARALGKNRTSIREWARIATATGDTDRATGLLTAAERLGCADAPQPDLLLGRHVLTRFPDRKPGPWTGKVLRDAQHAQNTGVFTDTASAAAWLAAYQRDAGASSTRS